MNFLKDAKLIPALVINRLRYLVSFPTILPEGEYGNSKKIRIDETADSRNKYLVFIRCGKNHSLIDDGAERMFEIVANVFDTPSRDCRFDFLVTGGVNKAMAFDQFCRMGFDKGYKGFLILDDDIESTYSNINTFFEYCERHQIDLCQPSLSQKSFFTYPHLITQNKRGHREVPFIEIMCPYFSSRILKKVRSTFNLSKSTWGIDQLWCKVTSSKAYVVDEIEIEHTRPLGFGQNGTFYKYMLSIGVDPRLDKFICSLRYGLSPSFQEKATRQYSKQDKQ